MLVFHNIQKKKMKMKSQNLIVKNKNNINEGEN